MQPDAKQQGFGDHGGAGSITARHVITRQASVSDSCAPTFPVQSANPAARSAFHVWRHVFFNVNHLFGWRPHLRGAREGCQRRFLHAVAWKGRKGTESAAPRGQRQDPPTAQRTDKDGHRMHTAHQAVPGTSPGKCQTATQTGNKNTDERRVGKNLISVRSPDC